MSDFRSVNRRQLISGAAAGGAVLAVGGKAAFATGGRAPAYVRTYGQAANIPTPREQTVVIEKEPITIYDSFNPFTPNGWAYHWGNEQICLEYLFYQNFATNEEVAWTGEKYAYNPDFTEFTLTLKKGVTFSDGKPMTSADVVFTSEMLGKNAGLSGNDIVNIWIAKVEAIDDLNVKFTLKKANPRFHYFFVAGIIGTTFKIVPKHIWEKQDPITFKNNPPVWTGSYMLQEANATQKMYVWKKNPNYWQKASFDPKPNFIIVRERLPTDAAVQEFLRGNIDIPNQDTVNYLSQQQIMAQDKDNVQLFFADPCPRGLYINSKGPTANGLFEKAEAHWALSYLIDRDKIGKTIWQPPSPAAAFPWANWKSNEKWSDKAIGDKYALTYDPDKAAQLLDSIGAKKEGDTRVFNGKKLELNMITPQIPTGAEYQIGDTIAREAGKIGLKINLRYLQTWSDAYQTGQFDISDHWICGNVFDPFQLYQQYLERDFKPIGTRTQGGHNETRTDDKALNDIALKLENLDPKDPKNMPAFNQGLEAYMQYLPSTPIIQTTYPFLYSTKYWSGWPTQDNQYTIGACWWGQFLFVYGKLQPTGAKSS
jgi:peptide/nickel transport system substrate-binding protein